MPDLYIMEENKIHLYILLDSDSKMDLLGTLFSLIWLNVVTFGSGSLGAKKCRKAY